jgi:uncharacterized membrane protein HdeD (DUF308 family)
VLTSSQAPHGLNARERYSPERYWYVLVITGVIGVAVGALVLADPNRSLKALAVIVGVYLLLAAVLVIARTVSDEDRGAGGLLLGILSLIAGVVVIRHPGQSIVVVSMALGIYFLVAGALDTARVIVGPRRLASLVRAVILIAAGTAIISSPEISVKTLALLTGIALGLQGAIQIGEGFVLRSRGREGTEITQSVRTRDP